MSARLAVVTSHPIQYQGPLFRAMAREIDLTVLFCCDHGQRPSYDKEFNTTFAWSQPITDGYAHEFVPSIHPRPAPYGFLPLTNPGLWTRLTRERFDALMLVGWGFASCWIALAAARAHGLKVLMRGESGVDSYTPRSPFRSLARRGALELLFRNIDAFLSIGTHNADLYRSYGIDESRIFLTPYAVDNEFFLAQAAAVADQRAALRAGLGVTDERPIVLTSGKLTERKAPLDLLRAFIRARREVTAKLVFLGDGPLRGEVEREAREAGIADDVLITGFRDQHELPAVYTAADLFAFPTHFETWGLVANEAMLCGLPVVCTDRVPAHKDLIIPGETGDVFPARDIDALAAILTRRLADPARLHAMGRAAREIVRGWNLEACVEGTMRALDHIEAA
jgi:glycosyltransferase involved in cell wall biosynthesis